MQAKNGLIVTLLIILGIIAVAGFLIMYNEVKNNKIEMPTAEAIAAKVVIPEVVIPAPDNQRVKEAWEKVYEDEINDLTDDAMDLCADEFDWDDVEDLIEDKYGKVTDLVFDDYYGDDTNTDIRDLGIGDEDDRHVVIDGEFFVLFKPETGDQDEIREKVFGECIVTSDDGDLEASLTLSL